MSRQDLESLLPHRGPMLLLAELAGGDEHTARAKVNISGDSGFLVAGKGLPAWILIEHFAQTTALLGGLKARAKGRPVRLGFLVGVRRFSCNQTWIPVGTELLMEASEEMSIDGGMSTFTCTTIHDRIEASCRLSVYIPNDEAPGNE